jgi:hypothetical protein
MKYNQVPRLIYDENGDELVWCSKELTYRPSDDFNTHKQTSWGYQTWCRECQKLYMGNPTYTRYKYVESETKIMLENLGYSFDSEFSIHEQFLIKHNLEPKKKKK